ncbi:MAG: ATP-grasp domain-containing protein [Methanobrevibacter sp.]|uniref:ATP-grasp domain-containing protein n=1 Tax=Methanobrevibacter sp. TaxID=66852 RepID=UPI001B56E660|nr:ATP-grasp domain-containing protein [Methanobrevibacter sp.]MBP3792383.1 ATP-grasp domain-containing protein [Methanobrevibacter sp.]
MKHIIVVDCISSGTNYIEDIVNRGYKPVILELLPGEANPEEYKQKMQSNYSRIEYEYDIIYEQDTYEKTLETVRKLDPLLIVAGSERGVILTSRLSNDLGLLGTPIKHLDSMTLKDKMHERLAEAGLRHIRGKVVTSIEEAIEFYDSQSLKEVVIKPIYSFCSVGVRICLNKQEMIDSLKEIFNKNNAYGDENTELLVQERINGEEYIVNTTSCEGIPRLISMWKYEKIKTSEGAIVYDTINSVNSLNLGEAEMVEYAYDVVRAIGIEYGPVHGEYMIDDKGPVLIEVNCRPAGLSMKSEYLDMIFGQHDTDSILDSYLNPERFNEQRKQIYRPPGNGTVKLFIAPEDILAKSVPMMNIAPKLKSYFDSTLHKINETELFVKTEDLNTTCGIIFLANTNRNAVDEDVEFLRSVEKNAFQLILSEESDEDKKINKKEIISRLQNLIKSTEKYGHGLLITDQDIPDTNILQLKPENIRRLHGHFDYILINLNKSIMALNDEESIKLIFKICSYIKVGGLVFIPKNTYDYLPGGRKGVEAMVKNSNFNIEAPPFGIKNAVIASKR